MLDDLIAHANRWIGRRCALCQVCAIQQLLQHLHGCQACSHPCQELHEQHPQMTALVASISWSHEGMDVFMKIILIMQHDAVRL